MEDAFSHAASNMVPLLIVLLLVFGALIGAALWLRHRVRNEVAAGTVKKRRSAADMCVGDMVTVLGRPYRLKLSLSLQVDGHQALWCVLQGDEEEARLLLYKDLSEAVQYPGQSPAPEGEAFPAAVQRDDGAYQRQGEPHDLGDGWRLARYAGPADRCLTVERTADKAVLWRGKSIPPEGVEALRED